MSDATGFGWNDTVSSEHELIPEGAAVFEVLNLKRVRKEMGQFGTCNVAELTLLVSPKEGGGAASELTVNLTLTKKLAWKIVQLATAVGLRKHGDNSDVDPTWWDKLTGLTGECIIEHRQYSTKSGKHAGEVRTTHDVKEFIAPGAGGYPF